MGGVLQHVHFDHKFLKFLSRKGFSFTSTGESSDFSAFLNQLPKRVADIIRKFPNTGVTVADKTQRPLSLEIMEAATDSPDPSIEVG